MSKGRPIVPVRFGEGTLSSMKRIVEQRNARTRNEPWTMSDFIRVAVEEKIAHMERSRRGRNGRKSVDNQQSS